MDFEAGEIEQITESMFHVRLSGLLFALEMEEVQVSTVGELKAYMTQTLSKDPVVEGLLEDLTMLDQESC